ncbi:unnamed protein product [Diamesa serratosioi]
MQLLIALSLIVLTIFVWIWHRQSYFKNHGIPYFKSLPLLGAFSDTVLGKCGIFENVQKIYFNPKLKEMSFFGIFLFHKPSLVITDPALIKLIMVKDFQHFTNRHGGSQDHDPIGETNLFFVKNPLWKKLRGKLTPFFSSVKLKTMFYILDKIGDDLNKHIHTQLNNNDRVELELKEMSALYFTDVIASCAFGVEANSLKNPTGDFRRIGKEMFNFTFYRGFELSAIFMLPEITKFFGLQQFTKVGTDFMTKTIRHVIRKREREGIKRNDLIDTLIEIKNSDMKADTDGKKPITEDMLIAQAAIFYAAGYETSSSTQTFALYETVKQAFIQNRLREEIKQMLMKTGGQVTYESVMNNNEMPYLHQIILETLRLYPVIPFLDRECVAINGYTSDAFNNFTIPHKMPILIPIFGIQRDEKYFPDPLKFDPERFAPNNKQNIVDYSFIPFGSGSRNCVGERLAFLQMKIGIIKILKDFRMETTPRTPKIIEFQKQAIVIQSKHGLYINLIRDPLL